jgi:thiopeptide-type bacteriocin biosynthesis protein
MKRDFCIGSEWLYFKIYTGVKTADLILIEKLYPVILELSDKNLILKWFFIRYKDTDEHLRIRFLLSKPSSLAKVIDKIYPVINALLEENSVWKIQTDTYQREIERYGDKTIEDSETLFWHDSEMILHYLVLKSSFEKEETQLLFSFLAIDQFLNSFSRSNSDKLFLMDELQSSFKNEFNADKLLRKQMDKQYRELFPDMEALRSGAVTGNYNELSMLIQEKGNQVSVTILSIKDRLQIPLASFLMSHIHMMLNRQYSSKQRMYELLIYDHMFRFYKMKEYKQFQDVIT